MVPTDWKMIVLLSRSSLQRGIQVCEVLNGRKRQLHTTRNPDVLHVVVECAPPRK
jgi:hypothetical protein